MAIEFNITDKGCDFTLRFTGFDKDNELLIEVLDKYETITENLIYMKLDTVKELVSFLNEKINLIEKENIKS